MLWTIVVILVILWLLGFFGRNISPSFPRTGSWIHLLVVIAVILIILNFLGVVNFCRKLAHTPDGKGRRAALPGAPA